MEVAITDLSWKWLPGCHSDSVASVLFVTDRASMPVWSSEFNVSSESAKYYSQELEFLKDRIGNLHDSLKKKKSDPVTIPGHWLKRVNILAFPVAQVFKHCFLATQWLLQVFHWFEDLFSLWHTVVSPISSHVLLSMYEPVGEITPFSRGASILDPGRWGMLATARKQWHFQTGSPFSYLWALHMFYYTGFI